MDDKNGCAKLNERKKKVGGARWQVERCAFNIAKPFRRAQIEAQAIRMSPEEGTRSHVFLDKTAVGRACLELFSDGRHFLGRAAFLEGLIDGGELLGGEFPARAAGIFAYLIRAFSPAQSTGNAWLA